MAKKVNKQPSNNAPKERRFWKLQANIGSFRLGRIDLTTDAEVCSLDNQLRFVQGRLLGPDEWPKEPPVLRYARLESRPEFAFSCGNSVAIVSDRIKAFLEQHAPGHAEFRLVELVGPDRETLSKNFWLVNWLHVWACIDEASGEFDSSKVPSDQHIGGVGRNEFLFHYYIFVDDRLKALLSKAKFVGMRFDRVHMLSRPGDQTRVVHPISGERTDIEADLIPRTRHFNVDKFLERFPGTSYPYVVPNSDALNEYVQFRSWGGDIDISVVRRLFEAGYSPNGGIGPNVSATQVSVEPKSPELLRLFNEFGADWRTANTMNGHTALMSVATDVWTESVELLLSFGADPNQPDFAGLTALHHWAEAVPWPEYPKEALPTLQALLKAGADPHRRCARGKTPLDYCDERLKEERRIRGSVKAARDALAAAMLNPKREL